jgi:hypothetical protein
MKRLHIFIFLLSIVIGCAGMETRVYETVRGPQITVGSYNIDISDDYKYLGQMPDNLITDDNEGSSNQTNVQIEYHVFVCEKKSEGILAQVLKLPGNWHFRSEVDFDENIKNSTM